MFSLPITNPNGQPKLPFDWLVHSGLILAHCHKILESDGCNFIYKMPCLVLLMLEYMYLCSFKD